MQWAYAIPKEFWLTDEMKTILELKVEENDDEQ
jgi:hypothetical protein